MYFCSASLSVLYESSVSGLGFDCQHGSCHIERRVCWEVLVPYAQDDLDFRCSSCWEDLLGDLARVLWDGTIDSGVRSNDGGIRLQSRKVCCIIRGGLAGAA